MVYPNGIDWGTTVMCLATVVLAVVTCWYAVLTRQTVREMRRQSESMTKQVEVAQRTSETAARSVEEMVAARKAEFIPIIAADVPMIDPDSGRRLPLLTFKNIGRFVARQVWICYGCWPEGGSQLWIDSEPKGHWDAVLPGLPLVVDYEGWNSFKTSYPQLFEGAPPAALAEFVYTDVFGNRYRSMVLIREPSSSERPMTIYWGEMPQGSAPRKAGLERRESPKDFPGVVE